MDFEKINRERDMRLRRSILFVLNCQKPFFKNGEMQGKPMVESVQAPLPPEEHFENERHVINLVRSLADKELLTMRTEGLKRGEHVYLRHLYLRITSKGTDLVEGNIPPIPGIWDDRDDL